MGGYESEEDSYYIRADLRRCFVVPDGLLYSVLRPDWERQSLDPRLHVHRAVIPPGAVSYTHLDVYKRQSQDSEKAVPQIHRRRRGHDGSAGEDGGLRNAIVIAAPRGP